MPPKSIPFKVRDFRKKGFFQIDDIYLNGYAKILGASTSMVYFVLCRHVDKKQSCFPAQEYIAKKLNLSERYVREKITILIEANIVRKKRVRSEKTGKWLHNVYFLVDKSQWKSPQELQLLWNHRNPSSSTTGTPVPIKDTHIKDTHTIDISIGKPYGNPDVNQVIKHFKEKLQLPMLDGSEKQNRQYAWLLLKKFNGISGVTKLIDFAAEDEFWQDKLASLMKLYYKGVEIISKKRGGQGAGSKTAIDASGLQ